MALSALVDKIRESVGLEGLNEWFVVNLQTVQLVVLTHPKHSDNVRWRYRWQRKTCEIISKVVVKSLSADVPLRTYALTLSEECWAVNAWVSSRGLTYSRLLTSQYSGDYC